MSHDLYSSSLDTGDFEAAKKLAEERVLDACNDLLALTGATNLLLQSRVGNGMLVLIGPRGDVLQMLDNPDRPH